MQLSRSSTVLTWDATLFSDILNSIRKFAQSLNFTASTKPNQHKTRLRLIKIIWQLGRICFSVLFNFFFSSRFSQQDRTVTLFQKRHSARARSPLQLPLSHGTSLQTPVRFAHFPTCPVSFDLCTETKCRKL